MTLVLTDHRQFFEAGLDSGICTHMKYRMSSFFLQNRNDVAMHIIEKGIYKRTAIKNNDLKYLTN